MQAEFGPDLPWIEDRDPDFQTRNWKIRHGLFHGPQIGLHFFRFAGRYAIVPLVDFEVQAFPLFMVLHLPLLSKTIAAGGMRHILAPQIPAACQVSDLLCCAATQAPQMAITGRHSPPAPPAENE